MKYMVQPIYVINDYMWEVYETASEHVIDTFHFEDDAIEYAEFLENGGAFDGFTPSFVLTQVALPDDINQKFNNLFHE
jgi:hypothetical protein